MGMIGALPSLHAGFLEKLIAKLQQDDRFEALLAGGSLAHGDFDEHSDLDLILVVRRDAYEQVLTERRQFAESLGGLVSAFTGEHVGEPRLLICLYGPELLHVDLKFVLSSDFTRLVERPEILWARDKNIILGALERAIVEWPNRSPEWFEDRAWIWLHYGATKLQRGELFEAMETITFFRGHVLGPMLHRRSGRVQRGVRKIELDSEAKDALSATVAVHDPKSVSATLMNAARLYLELREDERPKALTPGMPDSLTPLLTVK
jgi:predicted nucleotidyltransferase